MKNTALIKRTLLIASLGMITTGLAQAAHYKLDPNHTNARFAVDHFGTSTNTGGFYNLTGMLEYDPADKTGYIGVTIPVTTLDTGNQKFTDHLLSKDFFDVKNHKTMFFESTKFHFDGEKVNSVDGKLTMLGQTHPVTLTATKFNCYDSPMLKTKVCGGDFSTTIERDQWGMDTYADMGMMNKIDIHIQVEAAHVDDMKKALSDL